MVTVRVRVRVRVRVGVMVNVRVRVWGEGDDEGILKESQGKCAMIKFAFYHLVVF